VVTGGPITKAGEGPAGEGGPAGGHPARPHGLLEKLLAAVRPEFRADVLIFDPRDPVFGGPPCRVGDCERAARYRGMCSGHHERWIDAGRPSLAQFTAAADCRWRGRGPLLPCQVTGCFYGRDGHGLCPRHLRAWNDAGRPEPGPWLAGQVPAVPPEGARACLVPACGLWAHRLTPLCVNHGHRWRKAGCPDIGEFARLRGGGPPFPDERADLRLLGSQLRLELQYALQCRRDEERIQIRPETIRRIVRFLAGGAATSLLDRSEQAWRDSFPGARRASHGRAVLVQARRAVEDLASGQGWEAEYGRDTWRLRTLGFEAAHHPRLHFGQIPQPWLKDLAKRWLRWRLSTGLGSVQAYKSVTAITRFAVFLSSPAAGISSLAGIDRAVLELYLAGLSAEMAGKKEMSGHIGLLNSFFTAIRGFGWDVTLPANAMFFPEDHPRPPRGLPRYLAEHVMAQVEDPATLDRWQDPAHRLITVILIRCGLRISDALKLPHDCITLDAGGAPYLKYFNHKMKREALVPIDEELRQQIADQQQRALQRRPAGVPVLFPRRVANADGTRPVSDTAYRRALHDWLQRCDVRDEHGRPVHLTPHQWRHTLGTRLINRDVPQEAVRKILDHDSPEMTAHYARLHDTTVRRHWENARKVNTAGQAVTLDPDGPLAEAAWAKQRISRATQALPNGYCSLPLVKTCPHANSCLTCPMFVTTPEFLPQHHAQRQATLQIISAAEAAGHARVAEMNRQVAGNLDKIITALEADGQDSRKAAADAS
jgi:integrase